MSFKELQDYGTLIAFAPDMLYYLWATIEDAEEYKHAVDTSELDIAEGLCCYNISHPECYVQFKRLATVIINEQGLSQP